MSDKRKSILHIPAGAGRSYDMGGMRSVFLADCEETADTYSISEWWLDPQQRGPGLHSHEEDDIFYVLQGTVSFLAGDQHIEAARGAFIRVPGGVAHDFDNNTDERAGFLNLSIPGGFEREMPAIVQWFQDRARQG